MESSDFLSFVSGRRSVREYGSGPVAAEDLAYILDCARTAPSGGNLEAWDVIVVTEEDTRAALAEAAFDQAHIEQAPLILVVCSNYVRSMSRYGERGILYALEDATIACTYMMLAAHARDLQSCWTGAFDDDAVREILDLPQHARPVALLAVGNGHPAAGQAAGRMDIGEHVHKETW